MDHPIPRAARNALRAHEHKMPQNPGLIFDRFVPDWYRSGEIKTDGLEAVATAATKADARLLEGWNARWQPQ